jgi:hypothetical protein
LQGTDGLGEIITTVNKEKFLLQEKFLPAKALKAVCASERNGKTGWRKLSV